MRDPHDLDRLDRATSSRLAKLARRPVDMSGLERCLEEALPRPGVSLVLWQRWWRPLTTAAAAILIAVTLGWLALEGGTSTAMAAPAELAQIHFDVTNGLTPRLKVSSVAQANRLLKDQSNRIVSIPRLPGSLKSCCLHQYANTTLTCVLIERQGQLITVVLARSTRLHTPQGKVITRNGRSFIAHTANGVNMVMANEGDRWLCVMGDVATAQLVEVASDINMQ